MCKNPAFTCMIWRLGKTTERELSVGSGCTLNIQDLLRYIADYPASPPRTTALEQRIRIGTGFHGKWYRSQQEHWLGYLGYKRALWFSNDRGDYFLEPARGHWNRTHCFPMLFWLAESSGVDSEILGIAELAAVDVANKIRSDHPSHGKAARQVLPWILLEQTLMSKLPKSTAEEANLASETAYTRLAAERPDCRITVSS